MLLSRWFSRSSNGAQQARSIVSGRRRTPRHPAVPACIELLERRLVLATLMVTTDADVVSDGDGVLSLREAILIANDSTGATTFDGFSSTDVEDVIVFSDAVFDAATFNIPLDGTQLPTILESLRIDGAIDAGSARVTINAFLQSRIFDVDAAGAVRLEHLVLREGNSAAENGGAIRNAGNLELINVNVAASRSDASGGGVFNAAGASLTITGGRLRLNTAQVGGGGLHNGGGTLTLDGVLIDENYTKSDGGGLHNSGSGAVTVSDVIITRNKAEADGGGIWTSASGMFSLLGATIADNVADSAGQGGGAGAGLFVGSNTGTLNISESAISGNLGPATGGGLQIEGGTITIANSTISHNHAWSGAGIRANAGTLQLLTVTIAENDGGGLYNAGAALTLDSVLIHRNGILGDGGGLYNSGTGSVTGSGVVITDNQAGLGDGGGVWTSASGTFSLLGATIAGNHAVSGGGLFVASGAGTVNITDSTISGNHAGRTGGGIQTEGGTITLLGATIADNAAQTSESSGAGLFAGSNTGTLNIIDSTISGNICVGPGGGGLHIEGGTTMLTNSTVSNNDGDSGGGIHASAGALQLLNVTLADNRARTSGGGLHNDGAAVTLDNVVIDANWSYGDGAGLYNSGTGSVTASGVLITNNLVAFDGGGVWTSGSGTVSLLSATIAGNYADDRGAGAGVFVASGAGTVNITDSTISGNHALLAGGGLLIEGGTIAVANSTLSGNHAGNGGGIRANGGTMHLLSSTIAANVAEESGGGVDQQGAAVFAQSTIIATNSAAVSAPDFRGTLQSNGFNLIGNTAGVTISGATASDITNVDPLLGPLQDNGGPTLTHALAYASIAINAGFNAAESPLDQRGAGRTFGTQTDIGAYELHPDPRVLIAAPFSGGPAVRIFGAQTGDMLRQIWAYTPSFLGGVSVAAADLNGDGFPEIITGPGPGGGPLVRVFDGLSGAMLSQFFAFGQAFRGGIHVAVGDVDGDGTSEVIVAPRAGGGPAVRVFNALTGAQVGDTIWAFGRSFQGGVRIAGGDLDGDGTDELIAAAGPGGGSAFRVFNGLTGAQIGETTFAYDRSFLGGLTVSAGDLDGDGHAEIIVGPGEGEVGPLLRIFDGTTREQRSEFLAFGPGFSGGVAVAVGDVNGDGDLKVIAGAGPGGGPAVRVFDGLTGIQIGETLFAFRRAFHGGVVVAGYHPASIGSSPLRAEHSMSPPADSAAVLSADDLLGTIGAAHTRLSLAGLSAELVASLSGVQFLVTDLGGDLLGLARPGQIYLDDDAAGYGWFIDYSPLLDEEFFADGSTPAAIEGSAAAGRVDLLTVVLHELGHVLGLEHGDGLMDDTLPAGVRRLPTTDDFDGLFAGDLLDSGLGDL